MEIRYARMAVKVIEAMDRPTKHRMKEAIERLPQGDVKRLKGSGELYRLRVGGWRIVFSYPAKGTILIEKIAPREDVYKGGFLL